MTLHEYASAIAKSWLVVLILAVLGAGAGYAYSHSLTPQYRSTASVLVIAASGDNTSELVQGSAYVQNLVQSYSTLASSPYVLSRVIDDRGLDDTAYNLAKRVQVDVPLNTATIVVSVTDGSPRQAQAIAASTVSELAKAVAQLSPKSSSNSSAVRVATIAPARLPDAPFSPNTILNTGLSLLAGLVLGVIYAILRRRLDTKIVAADDLAAVSDLPVLGWIAATPKNSTLPGLIRTKPFGVVAESVRQVAAGFRFLGIDSPMRVIMITSGEGGEGKTSVSLALALTLAEAGDRVLYFEADLRRPNAGRYTQLEGSVGVTSVLAGDATLARAAQSWGHPNLDVLTSGVLPPNAGQLMSSGQLKLLIEEARANYAYVIVDSPPVLIVSDPLWLSSFVDGSIVVARSGKTRRENLRRTLDALSTTPVPQFGVILNGVKRSSKNSYYVEDDAEGDFEGTYIAPQAGQSEAVR